MAAWDEREGLPSVASLPWRVRDLLIWKRKIEELKPEVMAFELTEIRKDVQALKRAFYTFAFSVVGSAIIFAFTVFALLGKHP